jgi:hypothetical protein
MERSARRKLPSRWWKQPVALSFLVLLMKLSVAAKGAHVAAE